jgi:Proline racemase
MRQGLSSRRRGGESAPTDLRTVDSHTAGEPFRIVVSDVGETAGANVRERREIAAATELIDRVRLLLCHEPRGDADMCGCFVVPPDDEGADFGALFWQERSRSGRGTIQSSYDLGCIASVLEHVRLDPIPEVRNAVCHPAGVSRVVSSLLAANLAGAVVSKRVVNEFVGSDAVLADSARNVGIGSTDREALNPPRSRRSGSWICRPAPDADDAHFSREPSTVDAEMDRRRRDGRR